MSAKQRRYQRIGRNAFRISLQRDRQTDNGFLTANQGAYLNNGTRMGAQDFALRFDSHMRSS